ncbi:probable transmembrane ascorbate ferrireductase 2 [Cynara cardunculus var. scolymus]|uniref:probable transmembrane ascorbate ferrireductase 2 n=1 Tax=Cynara cardunculus var. scolymus TaxID=59895 RepID=UPI000D6258E3|nr:probable transmembrane ascorbate ferrireductase 2 [Cynara cardunculus var. scolymus]
MITYKLIPGSRQVLKRSRLRLQLIALAAEILGVYAVFKFHNELHMNTLRSWIGLSTICLIGFQSPLGFFSLLFLGPESATRARLARWHVFFSVVIFLMAIVTVETGLTENFLFKHLKRGQEALSSTL